MATAPRAFELAQAFCGLVVTEDVIKVCKRFESLVSKHHLVWRPVSSPAGVRIVNSIGMQLLIKYEELKDLPKNLLYLILDAFSNGCEAMSMQGGLHIGMSTGVLTLEEPPGG